MRKTFLTLLCVSSAIAHAADEDITFHGTLLSPPTCSISGGKTIEVEFRDLIIDDINGNYVVKRCHMNSLVTRRPVIQIGR